MVWNLPILIGYYKELEAEVNSGSSSQSPKIRHESRLLTRIKFGDARMSDESRSGHKHTLARVADGLRSRRGPFFLLGGASLEYNVLRA